MTSTPFRKTGLTRRQMLASTAAASAFLSLPAAAKVATSAADASSQGTCDTSRCQSAHDLLSRRLHDVLKNPALEDRAKNYAIKTSQCPHCSVRIGAGETGLAATAA